MDGEAARVESDPENYNCDPKVMTFQSEFKLRKLLSGLCYACHSERSFWFFNAKNLCILVAVMLSAANKPYLTIN